MSTDSQKPSWKRFHKIKFSRKSLTRSAQKIEKSTIRHARRFVSSRLDRLSLVKRAVFGWVVLVLVLLGVSLAQWMVFSRSFTQDTAANGGSYSEGVLGPLETLNPVFARSSAEKSASKLLFASLYTHDETGNIKGDLAESVVVNDSETEYTVSMKKGVTWSDGAPLTAEDVIFTVDILRDPTARTNIEGWQSFSVKTELVNATTVKFTLPGSYAPFISTLTFPILPQHVFAGVKPSEIVEQSFSQSPITSGPFAVRMLQDVEVAGDRKIVHMVSNPRYHRGAPKLDRFQLYVYGSRDDIEKALRTSEIMATLELNYADVQDDIKRTYLSRDYSINDGVFATFNNTSEILKSQPVRQALVSSVDTHKLRQKISRPNEPLGGPLISSRVTGELSEPSVVDTEKARRLLDEDGWKLVDGVRKKEDSILKINMVTPKSPGFSQAADELVKIWRKELGVQVDVRVVDLLDPSHDVYQSILQPRSFDVLVYELELGADPDANAYAYWHSSQITSSGWNFANYSSAVADDALASGRAKIGTKHRSDRYQAFVRRWLSDAPALALYQPKINYIQSKSAETLSDDMKLVFPEDRYANVIYWSVDKTKVYKTP